MRYFEHWRFNVALQREHIEDIVDHSRYYQFLYLSSSEINGDLLTLKMSVTAKCILETHLQSEQSDIKIPVSMERMFLKCILETAHYHFSCNAKDVSSALLDVFQDVARTLTMDQIVDRLIDPYFKPKTNNSYNSSVGMSAGGSIYVFRHFVESRLADNIDEEDVNVTVKKSKYQWTTLRQYVVSSAAMNQTKDVLRAA